MIKNGAIAKSPPSAHCVPLLCLSIHIAIPLQSSHSAAPPPSSSSCNLTTKRSSSSSPPSIHVTTSAAPLLYPARPLPAWRASALPQVLRSYRRLAVLHPSSRPCFIDDAHHSWSPRPRWLATTTSRLPKAGRSFDTCGCCCGWGGGGLLVGAQGPGVESPCRGGGALAHEWLVTTGGSDAGAQWGLGCLPDLAACQHAQELAGPAAEAWETGGLVVLLICRWPKDSGAARVKAAPSFLFHLLFS